MAAFGLVYRQLDGKEELRKPLRFINYDLVMVLPEALWVKSGLFENGVVIKSQIGLIGKFVAQHGTLANLRAPVITTTGSESVISLITGAILRLM